MIFSLWDDLKVSDDHDETASHSPAECPSAGVFDARFGQGVQVGDNNVQYINFLRGARPRRWFTRGKEQDLGDGGESLSKILDAVRLLGDESSSTQQILGIAQLSEIADSWPDKAQQCLDLVCGHFCALSSYPLSANLERIRAAIFREIEVRLRRPGSHWSQLTYRFSHARFTGQVLSEVILDRGVFELTGAVYDGGGLRIEQARISHCRIIVNKGTLNEGGYLGITGSDVIANVLEADELHVDVSARLDFSGSLFLGGRHSLSRLKLRGGTVSFARARIQSSLDFGDPDRGALLAMDNSELTAGELSFDEAHFSLSQDEPNVSSMVEYPRMLLRLDGATVAEDVRISFAGATFSSGGISLSAMKFNGGRLEFRYCRLKMGKLLFRQCEFSAGVVGFHSGVFEGGVAIDEQSGVPSFLQSQSKSGYPLTHRDIPESNITFIDSYFLDTRVFFAYNELRASGLVIDFKGCQFKGSSLVEFNDSSYRRMTVDFYRARIVAPAQVLLHSTSGPFLLLSEDYGYAQFREFKEHPYSRISVAIDDALKAGPSLFNDHPGYIDFDTLVPAGSLDRYYALDLKGATVRWII